jgi:hypothetical protein
MNPSIYRRNYRPCGAADLLSSVAGAAGLTPAATLFPSTPKRGEEYLYENPIDIPEGEQPRREATGR